MTYRPYGPASGKRPRPRQPVAPSLPASLSPARLPEDDLKDDGVYISLEYEEADLAGRDAAAIEIDQCRFRKAGFGGTKLDRAMISDSVFQSCDLANLRARECSFIRVSFLGSRMLGLSWAEGSVRDSTFEDCRMDLASFRFTTFRTAVFTGCKLVQADFQEADLRGARFERCDLTGAQFSKAQMEGTRFSDCELAGINGVLSLRGAVISSRDALALSYTLASALGITIED